MTQYIRFIFSVTLIHANIFRLGLLQPFFDTWFTQDNIFTELNSAIYAVHFSFATFFQYPNFVRFCSHSELKLSHRGSLQW